jgi:hypothetical protein
MPITAVDLQSVLVTALLNPVAIVVALWMGARADQWQKVPLAAFAASAAGTAVIYVAVWLGLRGIAGVGRAAAGVFIAQFLFGLVWAGVGYRFGRRGP